MALRPSGPDLDRVGAIWNLIAPHNFETNRDGFEFILIAIGFSATRAVSMKRGQTWWNERSSTISTLHEREARERQ
jgi:hypothetical protein